MDQVPEKVQETIFNQILNRAENKTCADCNAKSPNWCSIDFGVFICLQCAGAHRQLGPSVTRVRSTKLDAWHMDGINILAAVGNKIANNYWESKMPSYVKKLDMSSPMNEVKRFVQEKYVKRTYLASGSKHPVQEYLSMVKATEITPGEFYQSYIRKLDGNTLTVPLDKAKSAVKSTAKSNEQNMADTFKFLSAKPFTSSNETKFREDIKFNSFKPSNNSDSKSLFDSFKSAPYEKTNQFSQFGQFNQTSQVKKTKEVNLLDDFDSAHQQPIKQQSQAQQSTVDFFNFDSNEAKNTNTNTFNQVKSNSNPSTKQQQPQFQNNFQPQNSSTMQSQSIYDLYKAPTSQGSNSQGNSAQGFTNGPQNISKPQSNYAALDSWSQNPQNNTNGNFGMSNYQNNQQQPNYSNNLSSKNNFDQFGNTNPFSSGFSNTNTNTTSTQNNFNDNGFSWTTTSSTKPQINTTFESSSQISTSTGGSVNSVNPFASFGVGAPTSGQNSGYNNSSYPSQNTNSFGNSVNPWSNSFTKPQNTQVGSPYF